jgi:sulfur relay (sulfurtransferase) complex TusBCD TusD component (DsrE family)
MLHTGRSSINDTSVTIMSQDVKRQLCSACGFLWGISENQLLDKTKARRYAIPVSMNSLIRQIATFIEKMRNLAEWLALGIPDLEGKLGAIENVPMLT